MCVCRKSVVCPIIDVISDDTFEYITGSDMTWGGFNWKLNFRWYPVPQRELDRRNGDRSVPTRCVVDLLSFMALIHFVKRGVNNFLHFIMFKKVWIIFFQDTFQLVELSKLLTRLVRTQLESKEGQGH